MSADNKKLVLFINILLNLSISSSLLGMQDDQNQQQGDEKKLSDEASESEATLSVNSDLDLRSLTDILAEEELLIQKFTERELREEQLFLEMLDLQHYHQRLIQQEEVLLEQLYLADLKKQKEINPSRSFPIEEGPVFKPLTVNQQSNKDFDQAYQALFSEEPESKARLLQRLVASKRRSGTLTDRDINRLTADALRQTKQSVVLFKLAGVKQSVAEILTDSSNENLALVSYQQEDKNKLDKLIAFKGEAELLAINERSVYARSETLSEKPRSTNTNDPVSNYPSSLTTELGKKNKNLKKLANLKSTLIDLNAQNSQEQYADSKFHMDQSKQSLKLASLKELASELTVEQAVKKALYSNRIERSNKAQKLMGAKEKAKDKVQQYFEKNLDAGILHKNPETEDYVLLTKTGSADISPTLTKATVSVQASKREVNTEAENENIQINSEDEAEEVNLDEAALMPLDVSLLLNEKYVGLVSIKVDPRTNQGLIDSKGLLQALKPSVSDKFYSSLEAQVGNEKLVSFSSLTQGAFSLAFDNLSLEAKASLRGSAFDNQKVHLNALRPAPNPAQFVEPSRFTSGINISAYQRYVYNEAESGFDQASFDINGFQSFGGFEGLSFDWGGRYDGNSSGDKWQRRATSLTKDFFDSATRLNFGEITPQLDGFQGSKRIRGVGIQRAYSQIRPFQTLRPTGRQEFVLDEASTVEVYINNELVDTLDLQSGAYSLTDFPLANRANDVRLAIRGNSGAFDTLQFDVYAGSELLNPGLSEFGLFAGQIEGSDSLSFTDDLSASGYVRYGVSGNMTLGLNGQLTEQAQQLGAVAVLGNRYGLFQLEAAGSKRDADGRTGSAIGLNYRRQFSLVGTEDLRLSGSAEYRSAHFQHAFEDLSFNPSKWRSALQASWSGRAGLGLSLGVGANFSRDPASPEQYSLDLGVSKDLGRVRLGSSFGYTRTTPGDREKRFSLSLNYRPSQKYTASTRFDSVQKRREFDLRRISANQVGNYDASLRYSESERSQNLRLGAGYTHNRFELDYRHNHAFGVNQQNNSGLGELRLQTFVGFSGRQFGIGRPAASGFVLSPVHESLKGSNVKIFNGNELVAQSGLLGAPLVPLARPYAVNRYEIVVDDLPIGYDLGEGVISTFHGQGNSYDIPIGSDASRTAMGFLIKSDGPLSLISGHISPQNKRGNIEKLQRPFFTNKGGRFVADKLKSGIYEVLVNDAVIASFSIPEKVDGIVDLGEITVEE